MINANRMIPYFVPKEIVVVQHSKSNKFVSIINSDIASIRDKLVSFDILEKLISY
jgi:hypothetical protein